MPRFDSIESQMKDLKTTKDRAQVFVTDIIFHVNAALNSDNIEHDLRTLRDDLEESKSKLVRALGKDDDRGPNAPDDSESRPADIDPLRYDEEKRRSDTRVGETKPRIDDSVEILGLDPETQRVDVADNNGRYPGEEGFNAEEAAENAKIVDESLDANDAARHRDHDTGKIED